MKAGLRLRAQRAVPTRDQRKIPEPAAVRGRSGRRQSGKRLAAAEFHRLSLGFPLYGGAYKVGMEQFDKTGRIEWVTDLAEIPEKFGVKNVYGDLGQQSTVAEPRLCAAMMGQLVKGLGADHVVWGTDAVWTGAPQWQIEALRRLEIPEDMRKKHGFATLGPADGRVKHAIFGENSARLYKYDRRVELKTDAIALAKAAYEREGPGRTNLRYGYVVKPQA
ncbi:MAG: hypothetical protein ACXWCP_20485 [Burkholderiales bacterium]